MKVGSPAIFDESLAETKSVFETPKSLRYFIDQVDRREKSARCESIAVQFQVPTPRERIRRKNNFKNLVDNSCYVLLRLLGSVGNFTAILYCARVHRVPFVPYGRRADRCRVCVYKSQLTPRPSERNVRFGFDGRPFAVVRCCEIDNYQTRKPVLCTRIVSA